MLLGPGTDMSFASFVQAHAARADGRVALAQSQRQVQTQIAARAAQHGESARRATVRYTWRMAYSPAVCPGWLSARKSA